MAGESVRINSTRTLLQLRILVLSILHCASPVWLSGCDSASVSHKTVAARASFTTNGNVFGNYLAVDYPPADGFDLPVYVGPTLGVQASQSASPRLGWQLSSRFGEATVTGVNPGQDWILTVDENDSSRGEIHAAANGLVARCTTQHGVDIVIVEHAFYENNEKRKIYSLYSHVSQTRVRVGEEVRKGQVIGTAAQDVSNPTRARLHWELRWDQALSPTYSPSSDGSDQAWLHEHYAEPTRFLSEHGRLPVPQREKLLILVDQSTYKMRFYREGEPAGDYDVSLGQGKGQKYTQGDNKTPKGMYFVTGKRRGEFPGAYGGYYGGHWIKINYPNKYDAQRALADDLITRAQAITITVNWENRKPTLETTRLGGGIGFHGWIREWSDNGPRHLSWGCVVMHVADIRQLYDQIPVGAMV
ncbi:MAG TPA: L,D-transpeptidase family protein, partial [Blastocatellia bacterium]|nr:L,D-transpeptidase family protein [Blastocatellia bacterium]